MNESDMMKKRFRLSINRNKCGAETVQKVASALQAAGSEGLSMLDLMQSAGISRSSVDAAILALRKEGKPVYTIGTGKNCRHVWQHMTIITEL